LPQPQSHLGSDCIQPPEIPSTVDRHSPPFFSAAKSSEFRDDPMHNPQVRLLPVIDVPCHWQCTMPLYTVHQPVDGPPGHDAAIGRHGAVRVRRQLGLSVLRVYEALHRPAEPSLSSSPAAEHEAEAHKQDISIRHCRSRMRQRTNVPILNVLCTVPSVTSRCLCSDEIPRADGICHRVCIIRGL
jgi:hypothetical protein